MLTKIIMPEMGEGVTEGTLGQWLKQEGDTVSQYEPLLEIETDKVTTEAIAEVEGVLLKILVEAGHTVESGTILGYLGARGDSFPENGELQADDAEADTAAPDTPAQAGKKEPLVANQLPLPTPAPEPASVKQYKGRISPVVGRIAAEHEVDLNQLQGTGQDGRITKKDILAYIEKQAKPTPEPFPQTQASPPAEPLPAVIVPAAPSPDQLTAPAQPSPKVTAEDFTSADGILPLSNMRRAIAEHMVLSKRTSPHVTTVFEFDFTAVDQHRRAHKEQFARDGAHLTFTAYIIAATVVALKAHPLVNSSWSDDGIQLKREINIGMATAIADGLIVPVIKNADSMNLLGLARAINDLAFRARKKQLLPAEVKEGTFSITNHGVSGSLFATPIINQPQCGILGIGMIEKRVKVIADALAIRKLAYASFTFDHRILDGASADYFVGSIKEIIENWQ